jgi:hypothetical protein
MNPWTGEFTEGLAGYSPAMLVMLDFTTRLYGARRQGQTITWNCQLPESALYCRYTLEDEQGRFQLTSGGGKTMLDWNGRARLSVSGACSIVSDLAGEVISVTPLSETPVALGASR